MGRSGPAPAPTALKVVRGTRKDRINTDEPKVDPSPPEMPEGMDAASQKVWNRVLKATQPAGMITRADQDMLRVHCEAVARYEAAARLLASSSPLVQGARTGDLIKNPLHQIVRDNATLMIATSRELGLTPSARSGLRAPTETASPLMEYLKRGRRSAG